MVVTMEKKRRHYRKICGESAEVDLNVCKNSKESSLLPVLRRYDASNIFNADETGQGFTGDFYQTKTMHLLVIHVQGGKRTAWKK